VFLNPCGCAVGVMTAAGETKSKAWREFWGTRGAADRAMDRGVTHELVTHERYVAEHLPAMRAGCPHQGGTG
jgi:hypothetical protein